MITSFRDGVREELFPPISRKYYYSFLIGFLQFWGITFTISTTLVALFKHEIDQSYDPNEPHFGLIDTYKVLVKVLRLSSVRSMALILLTVKVWYKYIHNFID